MKRGPFQLFTDGARAVVVRAGVVVAGHRAPELQPERPAQYGPRYLGTWRDLALSPAPHPAAQELEAWAEHAAEREAERRAWHDCPMSWAHRG